MEKLVEVDRVRGKELGQQEPLLLKEPAVPGLLRIRPSSEQRCWSGPFSRTEVPIAPKPEECVYLCGWGWVGSH